MGRVKRIDAKEGRSYEVEGAKLPSVTRILSALAKPALVGWAAKEERLLLLQAVRQVFGSSYETAEEMVKAIEEEVGKKRSYERLMAKAADIGTRTHNAIESYLRSKLGLPSEAVSGGEHEAAVAMAFASFLDWERSVELEPLQMEKPVYSIVHGYAGTLDLIGKVTLEGERLLVIGDYKTGKRIYSEAFLQNVAYQAAWEEMTGERVDGGVIIRLPKVIDDPGFEVGLVPPREELWPVWVALLTVWKWWDEQERKGRTPK